MKKLLFILILGVFLLSNAPMAAAGFLTLNQTSVSIAPGGSINITYNSQNGQIPNVTSITNSFVAYANVSGNQITIYGLGNGSTNITFCTYDNTCAAAFVTVSGTNNGNNNNNNFGQIGFSQNSVNLNAGDISNITVYNSTNNTLYVSSNSNPNVAASSISGNLLNIRGQNIGTTTITVCANNQNTCASLNVTVNNNNSGSFYFIAINLPQPRVNQYYYYQLTVSGGTSPYNFTINSGNLPSGLFLTSGGLVYGTPINNNYSNVSFRANDYFGRSVTSQNITLTPTSGSVAGALLYNNGTLVNDNSTIWITYKNTKAAFTSLYAFTNLGYSLSNVIAGSTSSLNDTGYRINVITNPHPWGSWIKRNGTIYFAHESGLIPIPSMEIFTSNGGILRSVVEANGYDMGRPILPQMEHNDFRLR